MESLLTTIVDYLWRQSWQIALLVVVVGLASWALRNRSAHVRYLLWLLVLAKCLTPPVAEVRLAVLPDKVPPIATPIISITPPQESGRQTPVEEGLPLPLPLPPTPASAVREPLHLATQQWLAVGWLAGVAVFACVALTKAGRTILWLRHKRRTLRRTARDSFDETFRSLRVKRPPHVWLIEGVGQPFVWGILRGDIYLPDSFARVEDEHRRDILGHEISHVLRFDAAANLLQIIAQGIFWFHPLLWWANQQIRREREKCCDEMAIAHLGARPKDYSTAIIRTLIQAQESTRPVPSLAVAGPVKNIEERIRAMLRPGKRFHARPSLAVATTVVLIALVTIPTALVLTARGQAQSPVPSADEPAGDSKKPEQPRYAARTFNSELALRVSIRETSEGPMSHVGDTPSVAPLQIPACWDWLVEVQAPVKDWSVLAREMSLNKVPGLYLDSCTDADLKYLADLRDLRLLVLYSPSITDAGLEHLKNLTGLELLGLQQTRIADAGLAHLSGLTGLRDLLLNMTRVTDAGLVHLKSLTGLRNLSLSGTRITDAGLVHLKGLTGLRHLAIVNTRVTDEGLEHLKGLTGLQSLALTQTRVTGQGLVHLQALTGLEDLDLGNDRITDANLVSLDGLRSLRGLGLTGAKITDAGLTHIRNLTGLQRLTLRNTRITDGGLDSLKRLTELQQLGLLQAPITGTGLEQLRRFKGLQRLWLDYTQVGDAGLKQLEGLTGLRQLSLEGTQITDAGLEHLQGLTKLQRLYLNRTRITDAGLKHLQGLTGLADLGLRETQVSEAGARQLKQSLPKLTVWTTPPQPAARDANEPAGPVRKGGTLVFADNFDNGPSEKWQFRDKQPPLSAPGHGVENGQLRLSNATASLDDMDLANFIARARVCIKEAAPDAQGSFNISVRRTPSPSKPNLQERYALALISGNPGCLWLAYSYYDAAGKLQHAVVGFASCRVVQGQWYTLEFEVRGDELRVFLDGKLMVEARDERLTKGPLQISGGKGTVLVDDFSVYRLP